MVQNGGYLNALHISVYISTLLVLLGDVESGAEAVAIVKIASVTATRDEHTQTHTHTKKGT